MRGRYAAKRAAFIGKTQVAGSGAVIEPSPESVPPINLPVEAPAVLPLTDETLKNCVLCGREGTRGFVFASGGARCTSENACKKRQAGG